ncbi:RHS repeat-associated core domain-containing protein, partial [Bordetella sp. LUAb4]|uniref:RHS repeat-associated core domain-containing protein n=1 Tax=Bordetella sp. LUAb4 TaxID=2843195 RepID=UPI0027155E7A
TGDWSNSDREQYAYDGDGQRVRKYASSMAGGNWNSLDTRYLPGLELRSNTACGENLEVIVLDDGARVLNWVGGTGKPSDIPNLQLRFQYSDRQNSCQIETDKDGNVITQEEYYPYGGTAVLASRSDSEVKYKYIRYSGKERDATGLYYYGLRYYQPWVGRWINPDPAGTVDGQNLYRMVANNPITMVDAMGAYGEDPPSLWSKISSVFSCCLDNPHPSDMGTTERVAGNPSAAAQSAVAGAPSTATESSAQKIADRDQASPLHIPKTIHYVWVGEEISEDNLSNILLAAHRNPDYDVKIWTDRPMAISAPLTAMLENAENPLNRYIAGREQGSFGEPNSRISVEDISSVFEGLRASMPSNSKNAEGQPRPGVGAQAESLFHREKNGAYKNLAAASDIARMAIMFEKGGIYFDVDIISEKPLGTLLTSSGFTYSHWEERDNDGKIWRCVNNNILASIKGSALAEAAMIKIVENYAEYEKDATEDIGLAIEAEDPMMPDLWKKADGAPSWTIKRAQTDRNFPHGRVDSTKELSGPGVITWLALEFPPKDPADYLNVSSFGSRFYVEDLHARNVLRQGQGLPPSIDPLSKADAVEKLVKLNLTPLPDREKLLLRDWKSPPDSAGRWRAIKGLRRSSI